MKKVIFLILFILIPNNFAISNENDCNNFKKYSAEYFNCKTEIIKKKAIAIGKDFVDDTKKFQKKNYEDGKKQIENTKEKIEKAGEKF